MFDRNSSHGSNKFHYLQYTLLTKCFRRKFTVASLNVRGISARTKRDTLVHDLSSHEVDVCTLQETKISAGIDERLNGYRILSLPSKCRHYGLGFALCPPLADKVKRFWKLSDRVAILTLDAGPRSSVAVVNAYAPTATRCANDVAELDDFYSALGQALREVNRSTLVLFAGDFNAKVGTRQSSGETCIGSHSRGRRNISGQALIDFCEAHSLYLANTTFQHAAKHKTTWTGWRLDQSSGRTVPIYMYNQIDYILVRQSQKRLLTNSRSYGGCEICTDHRLVLARLQLDRIYGLFGKRLAKRNINARPPRYNTSALASDPRAREQFNDVLDDRLEEQTHSVTRPQILWNFTVAAVRNAAKTTIGTVQAGLKTHHNPDIAILSQTQKQLRIRIENTSDEARWQCLKKNAIKFSMKFEIKPFICSRKPTG